MSYTIDMEQISLNKYMKILQNQDLLPSRRILLDELEEKFQRIANTGIDNLLELKRSISSPTKLNTFSAKTRISEDYMIILKREINSLEQKPVPISDFPGISEKTIMKLKKHNVKTSKDFYTLFLKDEDMSKFITLTDLNKNEFDELYCLCNLVRINGVGPAAARALYESEYSDIPAIAHADSKELLDRISKVNSVGHYYNAKLGLKDMKFIIDYANLLLDIGKEQ